MVAAQLGVSFQQLQKYESGANRVSASRLFDLAHILMTPISYFFEDMPEELGAPVTSDGQPEGLSNVMNSRMTLDLIRDFYRIGSAHQRRVVLDLVRAMAGAESEEQPPESPRPQTAERGKPGRKRKSTA